MSDVNLTFEPPVSLYDHDSKTFDTAVLVGPGDTRQYAAKGGLPPHTILIDNYLQQVKTENRSRETRKDE